MKITFIAYITFSSLFFPHALLGADPRLPVTVGIHINMQTAAIVGGLTLCADGMETLSAINRSRRRVPLLPLNHSDPDHAASIMRVKAIMKSTTGFAIAILASTTFLYPLLTRAHFDLN
jgi:hypothetical protein